MVIIIYSKDTKYLLIMKNYFIHTNKYLVFLMVKVL